ncbi:MAG TPA: hypothetical protein VIJ62_08565, partial [Rhizomicrobium sp.]
MIQHAQRALADERCRVRFGSVRHGSKQIKRRQLIEPVGKAGVASFHQDAKMFPELFQFLDRVGQLNRSARIKIEMTQAPVAIYVLKKLSDIQPIRRNPGFVAIYEYNAVFRGEQDVFKSKIAMGRRIWHSAPIAPAQPIRTTAYHFRKRGIALG